MKKLRRGLATLLATLLLLSTLSVSALASEPLASHVEDEGTGQTVPGIEPESLLPLDEYHCTLDLTNLFPGELKSVPVATVLNELESYYDSLPTISGDAVVSWAKNGQDNYVTVTQNDKIDLSPRSNTASTVSLDLIVGTADQLDPTNIRYDVTVSITPMMEWLTFNAATADNPRNPIQLYDSYFFDNNGDKWIYEIGAKDASQPAYLSMELSQEWAGRPDVSAQVYTGYYQSEEEIAAAGSAAEDVTTQVWGTQATSAGYLADYSWKNGYEGMQSFTVVLKEANTTILVQPFIAYIYERQMNVSYSLYQGDKNIYPTYSYDTIETQTFTVSSDLAEQPFTLSASLHNPADASASNQGVQYVQRAVEGSYNTKEEIEQQTDIKNQLFSDENTGGYTISAGTEVIFSVLDTNGDIHQTKIMIKVKEEAQLPSPPTPLSQDTYFRIEGGNGLQAYVMPYEDDSYYYNGYQTVFLLDNTGNQVTDANIVPTFYRGPKVNVYAGKDVDGTSTSAVKQQSGITTISFQSGQPVQYSAAAENGTHLKNYWVTFLTQHTGGPKLFVNGTNVEDHYEDGMPTREVFLDEAHDYHHDIFIANIGDEALTNLTVTLSDDAQNIALDEYWTIEDGTRSLAPFTTTWSVANVAKIRLIPAATTGVISGTLTISADGQEPVKIKLKGTAGIPQITTDTLLDGVKYVPYSSVIQTSNMYDPDAVEFNISEGKLPAGVTLQANGEIYGVPTEFGEFPITVKVSYKSDPTAYDTKQFTLKILDNTDMNVENATDTGYELKERVPDQITEYTDQVFTSLGEYDEFQGFWLDGRKLTEGVDYISEPGSTKITIKAQTFQSAGSGKHTIAGEFRNSSKELRRAAQNYTANTSSHSGGGSGGGTSSTPSTPSYKITTSNTFTNGSVTFDRSSAKAGDIVGFTVTPKEGYELNTLHLYRADGTEIPYTFSNGKYTFKMPSSTFRVEATFKELPPQVTNQPFVDIREGNWYNDAVIYAYQNGLMNGTSDTTFAPNAVTTRAMVITTLYNLAGKPAVTAASFADVPANAYYADAATWAYEAGVVTGYTNGQLRLTDNITREQIAVMIYRYAQTAELHLTTVRDLSIFTDSDQISDYARQAIIWAYEIGLLNGKGNNVLDPKGIATRAELATILMRLDMWQDEMAK